MSIFGQRMRLGRIDAACTAVRLTGGGVPVSCAALGCAPMFIRRHRGPVVRQDTSCDVQAEK